MTKTIILTLALLASSFLGYSSGTNTIDTLAEKEPASFSTLIINTDVTVVLVNYEQASVEITGGKKFTQLVRATIEGDTLTIESAGNKYLLGKGTIYVPVRDLRNIQINSGAIVRSYYPLQIPKLDVVVNGECTLTIANFGTVNIIETKNFSAEQSTVVHHLPTGSVKKKA